MSKEIAIEEVSNYIDGIKTIIVNNFSKNLQNIQAAENATLLMERVNQRILELGKKFPQVENVATEASQTISTFLRTIHSSHVNLTDNFARTKNVNQKLDVLKQNLVQAIQSEQLPSSIGFNLSSSGKQIKAYQSEIEQLKKINQEQKAMLEGKKESLMELEEVKIPQISELKLSDKEKEKFLNDQIQSLQNEISRLKKSKVTIEDETKIQELEEELQKKEKQYEQERKEYEQEKQKEIDEYLETIKQLELTKGKIEQEDVQKIIEQKDEELKLLKGANMLLETGQRNKKYILENFDFFNAKKYDVQISWKTGTTFNFDKQWEFILTNKAIIVDSIIKHTLPFILDGIQVEKIIHLRGTNNELVSYCVLKPNEGEGAINVFPLKKEELQQKEDFYSRFGKIIENVEIDTVIAKKKSSISVVSQQAFQEFWKLNQEGKTTNKNIVNYDQFYEFSQKQLSSFYDKKERQDNYDLGAYDAFEKDEQTFQQIMTSSSKDLEEFTFKNYFPLKEDQDINTLRQKQQQQQIFEQLPTKTSKFILSDFPEDVKRCSDEFVQTYVRVGKDYVKLCMSMEEIEKQYLEINEPLFKKTASEKLNLNQKKLEYLNIMSQKEQDASKRLITMQRFVLQMLTNIKDVVVKGSVTSSVYAQILKEIKSGRLEDSVQLPPSGFEKEIETAKLNLMKILELRLEVGEQLKYEDVEVFLTRTQRQNKPEENWDDYTSHLLELIKYLKKYYNLNVVADNYSGNLEKVLQLPITTDDKKSDLSNLDYTTIISTTTGQTTSANALEIAKDMIVEIFENQNKYLKKDNKGFIPTAKEFTDLLTDCIDYGNDVSKFERTKEEIGKCGPTLIATYNKTFKLYNFLLAQYENIILIYEELESNFTSTVVKLKNLLKKAWTSLKNFVVYLGDKLKTFFVAIKNVAQSLWNNRISFTLLILLIPALGGLYLFWGSVVGATSGIVSLFTGSPLATLSFGGTGIWPIIINFMNMIKGYFIQAFSVQGLYQIVLRLVIGFVRKLSITSIISKILDGFAKFLEKRVSGESQQEYEKRQQDFQTFKELLQKKENLGTDSFSGEEVSQYHAYKSQFLQEFKQSVKTEQDLKDLKQKMDATQKTSWSQSFIYHIHTLVKFMSSMLNKENNPGKIRFLILTGLDLFFMSQLTFVMHTVGASLFLKLNSYWEYFTSPSEQSETIDLSKPGREKAYEKFVQEAAKKGKVPLTKHQHTYAASKNFIDANSKIDINLNNNPVLKTFEKMNRIPLSPIEEASMSNRTNQPQTSLADMFGFQKVTQFVQPPSFMNSTQKEEIKIMDTILPNYEKSIHKTEFIAQVSIPQISSVEMVETVSQPAAQSVLNLGDIKTDYLEEEDKDLNVTSGLIYEPALMSPKEDILAMNSEEIENFEAKEELTSEPVEPFSGDTIDLQKNTSFILQSQQSGNSTFAEPFNKGFEFVLDRSVQLGINFGNQSQFEKVTNMTKGSFYDALKIY